MDGKNNTSYLIIAALLLGVLLTASLIWKQKKKTQSSQWDHWNGAVIQNPPVIVVPPPPPPEPIITDPKSYQEALQSANQQNKAVLLVFESDGCSWCQKMRQDTFENSIVKESLKEYVVYFCNATKDESTVAKYGVRATPTYFVVTSSEQKLNSGAGYKNPVQFISWLTNK